MKVYLQEQFARNGWSVYLYVELGDEKIGVLQPDGSRKVINRYEDPITKDVLPTFDIDRNTAQELITCLQACGVRPIEITKVEGVLEAQTKHLEDLRNILKTKKMMS